MIGARFLSNARRVQLLLNGTRLMPAPIHLQGHDTEALDPIEVGLLALHRTVTFGRSSIGGGHEDICAAQRMHTN